MTSISKTSYSLPDQENKAQYVKNNFNEIAPNYDRFNDLITLGFHRRWKKKTVLASGLAGHRSARVLDLCCGSGDLSFAFRSILGPGSKIHSLDFSEGMLELFRKRLSDLPESECEILPVQGDALDLSRFQTGSLDAVSIGFGLRNVTNREKCLKEMFRVLKPGGRAIILDVSRVNAVFSFFAGLYFDRIVPLIGSFLQGKKHEMYDYLPASARQFPDQLSLKKELESAGFGTVTYRNFFLGAAALHVAEK